MTREDEFQLRVNFSNVILLQTYDNGIVVCRFWDTQGCTLDHNVTMRQRFTWTAHRASETGHTGPIFDDLKERSWLGFSFLQESEEYIKTKESLGYQMILVPHTVPVVLLTMLSALLILWKPRKYTAVVPEVEAAHA